MNSAQSKIMLITGAAQGIGFHLVGHYLQMGAKIVAVDSHQAALGSLEKRHLDYSNSLRCLTCDVGNETEVNALISSVTSNESKLDVLINNAAVSHNSPPESLTLADWERVLAINLTAPFLLSRLAAPLLRKTNGCIVNMASTRALMSEPNTEAYSASKGGIVALTHAMAMSLGPSIRVNCISPGWIDVSHLQHPIPDNPTSRKWSDYDHRQHPCGRVGKPEDIAVAIDYLIGDGAGFVTGQNLIIDGGMTRKMIYE